MVLLEQLAYGLVIVATATDRFVEDRRIRRHAGDATVHQALQAAAGHQVTVDEVEPYGLAVPGEIEKRSHD